MESKRVQNILETTKKPQKYSRRKPSQTIGLFSPRLWLAGWLDQKSERSVLLAPATYLVASYPAASCSAASCPPGCRPIYPAVRKTYSARLLKKYGNINQKQCAAAPERVCPLPGCLLPGCPLPGCPLPSCPLSGCPLPGCPLPGCPLPGCVLPGSP